MTKKVKVARTLQATLTFSEDEINELVDHINSHVCNPSNEITIDDVFNNEELKKKMVDMLSNSNSELISTLCDVDGEWVDELGIDFNFEEDED
jgi:hypothetical protein